MTEKKWTPGPWVVKDESYSNHCCFSHSIGLVTGDGKYDFDNVCEVISQEDADAHLIAAAPDLYDSLDMARVWLEFDGRCDMQVINAALAKARGEQ